MSTQADTFERSCAHWSDAARAEMEAFYELAQVDYRYLAEAFDWAGALGELARAVGRPRLVDIACGSGKFPAALIRHAGLDTLSGLAVDYDLLDPSDFSLREARSVLEPPFVPGHEFCCTLQDWEGEAGSYDVAWATHALYCVPAEELTDGLRKLCRTLAPHGLGFVAQGLRAGHYVRFYDEFRASFRANQGTPYSDGAQVEAALRELGMAVRTRELNYITVVPAERRELLEQYLQRCAFDDTVGLEAMLTTQPLSDYLASAYDSQAQAFHFQQRVSATVFAHDPQALRLEDR